MRGALTRVPATLTHSSQSMTHFPTRLTRLMTQVLAVLLLVPGTLTQAAELRTVAREGEDFAAVALRTLG